MPRWFRGEDKSAPPPQAKPPQDKPRPAKPEGGSSKGAKARRVPSISVGALLTEELIWIQPPFTEKNPLLEAMARKLCQARAIADPEGMIRLIKEREKGIFTTLDTGLSLPHARVDKLKEVAAILSVPTPPVPDPRQSEYPIRAIFLFLAPTPVDGTTYSVKDHLQFLRGVSMLFQPNLIDQLQSAGTPAKALELIRSQEAAR